jgi:hypothetical protein
VNADSEIFHEPAGRHTSDTVSGYLAAIAIFTSLIGIAWHPLRLILPALLVALVAAGMGTGKGRLQLAAVLICGVSLFLGLTVAVVTSHALW